MNHWHTSLRFFLLTSLAVVSGCNSSSEGKSGVDQALLQRLVVAQQPDAISSLKSVYESLQPGQVVTVAGRIYADGKSPFDQDRSVFTVVDLPKPGHNHEDPGDCPFCRRELKNAKMAIVRVVDAEGKLFSAAADELLGLKKNQDIVITGVADQIGDTLEIRVSGLHLLTKEVADQLSATFHAAPQES